MARINLLPWRAERRKQRQKEFGLMLGFAAAAAIGVSLLISSYYDAQIEGQNERNAFVRDRITEVEKQITEIQALDEKKARLLARKDVIEQLQASRSQMVHLFDSLVRTIPDGVVLTAVKQDDQVLTLQGRSQSNARVSTYLRNLESSGWMTQPELSIIEAKGTDKGLPYEFSLQVRLANPSGPTDGVGNGAGDVPATDAAAPAAQPPAPAAVPAPAATPEPAPAAPAAGGSASLEGAAS